MPSFARVVSDFASAMARSRSIISVVPAGLGHQVLGQRTHTLPGLTLDILATRRIELTQWRLQRLSDPYWRLYWPLQSGGAVQIGSLWTALEPGQLYLIPPRTSFSTTLKQPFAKWYCHFSLGPADDRVTAGIYRFAIEPAQRTLLRELEQWQASADQSHLPWAAAELVSSVLRQMPASTWQKQHLDARLLRAMEFMHQHLGLKLSAAQIARHAGLSTRNLNHLFTQHCRQAPMRVLLGYRLDAACQMLRHGRQSIEQIAERCGLTNRHYLSRMLRLHRNTSPALYRRETTA